MPVSPICLAQLYYFNVIKERMKMMNNKMIIWKMRTRNVLFGMKEKAMQASAGIDGILVTVGLCIIALLLCVVMKDSLTSFIQTLVTNMTSKAQGILNGVTPS